MNIKLISQRRKNVPVVTRFDKFLCDTIRERFSKLLANQAHHVSREADGIVSVPFIMRRVDCSLYGDEFNFKRVLMFC